jgi:hypothetical protein
MTCWELNRFLFYGAENADDESTIKEGDVFLRNVCNHLQDYMTS